MMSRFQKSSKTDTRIQYSAYKKRIHPVFDVYTQTIKITTLLPISESWETSLTDSKDGVGLHLFLQQVLVGLSWKTLLKHLVKLIPYDILSSSHVIFDDNIQCKDLYHRMNSFERTRAKL